MTPEPSSQAATERYRKYLLRAGLAVLGVGFLIALAAAAILGREIAALEPTATAVHRAGLLVMLAGFFLVLGSSRIPQLLTRSEGPGRGGVARVAEGPGVRGSYSLEVLLVGCLVTGVVLMFILLRTLGAWLTIAMAIVVPAILTVLIVYTKGWRRAFCIGAIFPAGTVLLFAIFFTLTEFQSLMEFGYVYLSLYGAARPNAIFAFQICVVGGWFLMFVSGTIASVLFSILCARNGEPRPGERRA
ncbi:MAG: hypothetical protein NTY19_10900 [Planctomycetota bacterium]|nr:hypothetical protein [Planctomycetota bacterium]